MQTKNKKCPDVGSVKGKNKNTYTVYPFRMRLSIKIRKALDRFFNWIESKLYEDTYRELERKYIKVLNEKKDLERELHYLQDKLDAKGVSYRVRY